MAAVVEEREGGEAEEEGEEGEEKAAEAARLRREIELVRRRILWKEERISVLEEGVDASGAQQGAEQLTPSGDPAPESVSALPDSSPA
ncbi:uncharacterized protein ARB_07079 [Trichophyton benhamiae CBS 112371]|uniref:Uncharacterized protein n=1 Tax=Arthroderma benhamiae (strain ATCC MYA-4681 / CBS 112371) TaxID=663331 RepID=D4AS64_ARTBC|nr:uncharacterized protein ARB_07079 [Trichophyton benhamiae CBS 112371]EFE34128.1 hypothetical protein ARB_07079 [Trichophyton benhamiae CBS 112371]